MINSLEIQNFQGHKHSELKFHKGVNVIIGDSEQGKTSIIRSLRWLSQNKPGGESFRSWWGGDTVVKVELQDGNVVIRNKSNENSYFLNKTKFVAFGQDVPEEIQKALNFDEANIQTQFESHFLLSNTSGEVAAYFNKISHLDVIDKGVKNVKKWLKEISQSVKVDSTILKQAQEQVDGLQYLTKLEIDVEILETEEIKLQNTIQRKVGLEKLRTQIVENKEEIEELQKEVELEPLVNSLFKTYKVSKELNKSKTILQELIFQLSTVDSRSITQQKVITCEPLVLKLQKNYKQKAIIIKAFNELTDLVQRLKKGTAIIAEHKSIITLEVPIASILKNQKQRKVLNKQHSNLNDVIIGIQTTKTLIQSRTKEKEQAELQFKQNFPDVCPLCGSIVKTHKQPK